MLQLIRSFLVLFLLILTFSCTSEIKDKHTTDAACGELTTFTVDEAFCRQMDLPVAKFSLQYPKMLKTDPPLQGYENLHYNYFFAWDENEIQTESISLGYSTTQRNTPLKGVLKTQILQQVKAMLQQTGFNLTEEFLGDGTFDGKEYAMFRAKGSIQRSDIEFVGNYLIQCLIVEPEVDNENGVFAMMMANQDSDIASFDDFGVKGCTAPIWQSLTFNY
jgi:hypothetical protein